MGVDPVRDHKGHDSHIDGLVVRINELDEDLVGPGRQTIVSPVSGVKSQDAGPRAVPRDRSLPELPTARKHHRRVV